MNYIIYDNIPKIPEDLLTTSVDDIKRLYPDGWKIEHSDVKKYSLHPIVGELYDYLSAQFPEYDNFSYQLILPDVPIHVDSGRIGAINYLIHLGGANVETTWYNDDTLIDSVVFPDRTWHYVKTDIPHGIINLTDIRVAITISVKSEKK